MRSTWPSQHDAIGHAVGDLHGPRAEQHVWTNAENARLREGRAANVPFSVLAVEFGVTKNQTVKQAHRLGINGGAEASPIRRFMVAPEQSIDDPGTFTPFHRGCDWPHGEPGTPGFRFCGAERGDVLSPYCADHYRQSRSQGPSAHSIRMTELHAKRRAARDRMMGR